MSITFLNSASPRVAVAAVVAPRIVARPCSIETRAETPSANTRPETFEDRTVS